MRVQKLIFGMAAVLALSACVESPPARAYYRHAYPAPTPVRFQEVLAYPARGQSPEQLDRDRYECHRWATQQTGFDPSQAPPPPISGTSAEPVPGSGLAVGAIAGAVLGSIIAPRGSEGGGAVVGAITGGAIGAATENAERAEAQRDRSMVGSGGYHGERAGAYRRALSACLEGRGYSVK
jgi:hypothetical protein